MPEKADWEKFFDGHAPVYLENDFTANTINEVDFLIKELRLKPGAAILDVGCGTGRHAIELARRGFKVTGVDLSEGMLAEARRHAADAGVQITLIHADAARWRPGRRPDAARFDAVICLCEGAFGLLGSRDDALGQPLAILRRVARALKPGARCVFTVLNGYGMVRRHSQEDADRNLFDPLTLSEVSDVSELGAPAGLGPMRERGFVPTELQMLFLAAGLTVLHMWGGTAGDWGRRPIKLDEYEIMVVATPHRTMS